MTVDKKKRSISSIFGKKDKKANKKDKVATKEKKKEKVGAPKKKDEKKAADGKQKPPLRPTKEDGETVRKSQVSKKGKPETEIPADVKEFNDE